MKILVIDPGHEGLPFTLAAQEAGHTVRLWQAPRKGQTVFIGKGMVDLVNEWKPSMNWADLIVLTENSHYEAELEPYFQNGYPIFGCNKASAALEVDRDAGQLMLEECGIDTLPFETFSSYDKAIEHVRKTGKTFVCKAAGNNPDKSLSYVAKSPADLIFKLERWKQTNRLKGKFLLQEKIDGCEMAVGGWLGPEGFCAAINENWEEKRLMNGGLGVNTGEMGTVMRYAKRSKLFDEVLKPCEERLIELGYVGYVDQNCIIDESGKAWPLEFTMRFGWPHFNLCLSLHKGDPAEWMLDLLEGRDRLRTSSDVCVGVVMVHGDFPYGNCTQEEVSGFPITGIKPSTLDHLRLARVQYIPAPVDRRGEVVERLTYCTAGDYVAIATGCGKTVCDARGEAYDLAWSIDWPSNRMFRTDIGCRLEEGLPKLQAHGYATDLEFGEEKDGKR